MQKKFDKVTENLGLKEIIIKAELMIIQYF